MNHNPLHIEGYSPLNLPLTEKLVKKIKLKLKYQLKEFGLTLGTQHSIDLK